jgi:hypothetical protein
MATNYYININFNLEDLNNIKFNEKTDKLDICFMDYTYMIKKIIPDTTCSTIKLLVKSIDLPETLNNHILSFLNVSNVESCDSEKCNYAGKDIQILKCKNNYDLYICNYCIIRHNFKKIDKYLNYVNKTTNYHYTMYSNELFEEYMEKQEENMIRMEKELEMVYPYSLYLVEKQKIEKQELKLKHKQELDELNEPCEKYFKTLKYSKKFCKKFYKRKQ